jgi:hypothetical protein
MIQIFTTPHRYCTLPSSTVGGVKFLVLDMTPVTRSDSSGATFLHDLAKDLKAQGIQLALCNPTDAVRGADDRQLSCGGWRWLQPIRTSHGRCQNLKLQ